MNSDIKTKWVAALRSGEFKQGREVLRTEKNDFCCLGVLCELFAREHPSNTQWVLNGLEEDGGPLDFEVVHGPGFGTREVDQAYLPMAVMEWAGMSECNPPVELDAQQIKRTTTAVLNEDCKSVNLSDVNDKGFTFNEIADLIDAQL